MKIELVDDIRIKVVLSCYDILELSFDVGALSLENSDVKNLIEDILKEAEEKFGFHAKAEEVSVEVISYEREGYSFYVIKNSDKRTQKNESYEETVFSFLDYETLKNAVEILSQANCESSKLFLMDDIYYLVIIDNSGKKTKEEIRLTDFGQKIANTIILNGILNEYGKLIYKKNAIKMIKNQKN